ncbi:MAG TPA: ATP-binding protein [Candidatus Nanoarchaeia archaeon]|nr:ATP-binding protein [Candidatus Nanoarchaeia archaeon]
MREKKIAGVKNIDRPKLVFSLRIASLILAAVVIVIGILALVGWQFNNFVLITSFEGFVPMNPLAAVEFIIIGSAIVAAFFWPAKLFGRLSVVLAFLAIALALIKLADILGFNLPVDQVLFAQKLSEFSPASRVPPIADLNFILLGIAVILSDIKFCDRDAAQYFAFIAASLALFMFLAYLFGSPFQVATIFFSPLALQGALNFIFLSTAIIFLRPSRGLAAIFLKQSGGGFIARRLIPLTLGIPVTLALAGDFLINRGWIDFQLAFAIVLVLNIIIFEFINWHYSSTIDHLEEEQKRIREAISRAKALDDALLQSIGDGLVATDRQGVVILFNHEAEKMFGIKASKAIGKSIFKLWSIFDKDGRVLAKKDRPLQTALINGKTVSSLVSNPYYYAAGKRKVPVAITVTPVIFRGGIIGAIDVFRDISRDVEIDQAKSEFVSFASHQLRGPSTAIGWQIEMFLEKYGDKLSLEQREKIDDIYRSNRQISELITDFLNVSKIEYGLSAVESAPVNIASIITQVLNEQFKLRLEEKKIKAEEKFDRGICSINADANLFKLIVENLVSNAIKYSPIDGKITVELVRAKAGETLGGRKLDKDSCLLIVSDNGFGIPKDEQDKIFTRFFRANNAIDRKIPGTGLGLYMVKLFIQRMGGDIWFQSEENVGTKFFVLF